MSERNKTTTERAQNNYHTVKEGKESRKLFFDERYSYLQRTSKAENLVERDYAYLMRHIDNQARLDRRYKLTENNLTKQRYIVYDDWDYFQVVRD